MKGGLGGVWLSIGEGLLAETDGQRDGDKIDDVDDDDENCDDDD
tara:strand:+ start:423 stop:554 length:132 start_codon:yes stop_codon:yes gene_type:complete